jgi:hypothetical protein
MFDAEATAGCAADAQDLARPHLADDGRLLGWVGNQAREHAADLSAAVMARREISATSRPAAAMA